MNQSPVYGIMMVVAYQTWVPGETGCFFWRGYGGASCWRWARLVLGQEPETWPPSMTAALAGLGSFAAPDQFNR